jgi:L-aspartate oxidase
MFDKVGVERDGFLLREAMDELAPVAFGSGPAADAALVGFMIAAAALRRQESRGTHWRADFPQKSGDLAQRTTLHLEEATRMLDDAENRRALSRPGA